MMLKMLLLLRAYAIHLCCLEQIISGIQLFGTGSVCMFQGNVRPGEGLRFVLDLIEQDCFIDISLLIVIQGFPVQYRSSSELRSVQAKDIHNKSTEMGHDLL